MLAKKQNTELKVIFDMACLQHEINSYKMKQTTFRNKMQIITGMNHYASYFSVVFDNWCLHKLLKGRVHFLQISENCN